MFDLVIGIFPQQIHFDLTFFPLFSAWLFETGKRIFEMLNFDFLGYTLNGWALLIGIAILSIICYFIGRILQ